MKRQIALGILLATSLSLTACQGKYDNTAIVKIFEAGGGGDPHTASVQAIAQYLNNHNDLVIKLRQPCAASAAHADSNWPASSEGKICAAVRDAAFFAPVPGPDNSDKSKY